MREGGIRRRGPRLRKPAPGATSVHLLLAAVTGAALILPFRAVFPDCGPRRGPLADKPIELSLLVASQKRELVAEIVNDFHDTGPRVDGRCIEVVEVTPMTSGRAAEELAKPESDYDVWLPSATSWVDALRTRLKELGRFREGEMQVSFINMTPEVIAMPRPMAEYLERQFGEESISWETIYGLAQGKVIWPGQGPEQPEWGPFRLIRTNPNSSTSGLYSTIFAYSAGKKHALKRSDCTLTNTDPGTLTKGDVRDKCVREFVGAVESSVLYYADSSLEALPYLAEADTRGEALQFVSAITVQEVSVVNYNLGSENGSAIAWSPKELEKQFEKQLNKQHPKERKEFPSRNGRLKAIYPKEGTEYANQPYVILNRGRPEKTGAAEKLEQYFVDDPENKFAMAGFRESETHPTGDPRVLSKENGAWVPPPGASTPPRPGLPGADVIRLIKESWAELRKVARVMVLVDVADPAVKDAACNALEHLRVVAPRQEVGLRVVTGQAAGGPGYVELVPLQTPIKDHPSPSPLCPSEAPTGGTSLRGPRGTSLGGPLEEAIRFFQDSNGINVVVVLTDGYDTDTFNVNGSLKQVLTEANRHHGVRLFPVGFGAAGKGPACDRLKAVAAASGTTPSCIGRGTPPIEDVLIELVERF